MKRLCAAALLFLLACNNSDGPSGPTPQQQALTGVWGEVQDTGTASSKGSFLTFSFIGNSLEIQETWWTDVRECAVRGSDTVCSDVAWVNSYRGDYGMKGDVMELAFNYLGTTADAPADHRKMPNGVFRVRYGLRENDPSELVLDMIDRERPLAGKERIVLNRVYAH